MGDPILPPVDVVAVIGEQVPTQVSRVSTGNRAFQKPDKILG